MSVIKHKDQRVVVLMDVQNLYHSAKNIFSARVNFKEVLKTAVAGRKLIRAVAYVIKSDTGEEKAFFDALTKSGIETRTKDLQIFPGGMKKGDWDVGIAMDAIRMAPLYDVMVLVSGDGDFVPMLEYLKNQGRQVEVMAFARSASNKLKEEADEFIDLATDKDKYLILQKQPKGFKLGRWGL
jgi:uncharacterized LabA/DUF88 family protein